MSRLSMSRLILARRESISTWENGGRRKYAFPGGSGKTVRNHAISRTLWNRGVTSKKTQKSHWCAGKPLEITTRLCRQLLNNQLIVLSSQLSSAYDLCFLAAARTFRVRIETFLNQNSRAVINFCRIWHHYLKISHIFSEMCSDI